MKRTIIGVLAPAAVLALVGASCGDDDDDDGGGDTEAAGVLNEVQAGDSILDTVIANDVVRCGVRDDFPGFNILDEAGEHAGFDADFCGVIAAAVLGDATKVELVDVETDARFTALQSGEFDVLVRNTTWTASRDGTEGVTFLHPTFYDGQGMMVAADSGITSLDDMDGAVVCVAAGTTTEGNVATEFERRGLGVDVQSFEDVETLQTTFEQGGCDGWSSDTSQLVGFRMQANSEDPNIRQFLGGENADGTVLDPGLGLDPAFAFNVVDQVGNYGEIFEAHLAPLGIERGVNALWIDGGLQYAPPYR